MTNLSLLLIAMVLFSATWFPLLWVEVIENEDSGTLYFVSMITNVCAMFIGVSFMFILMRKVALDAIGQFDSNS
jgi:hypothetical protein